MASAAFAEVIGDLPRERSAVLPALLRIQRRLGYVPGDAVEAIAAHLRLTASDVDGIATGYPDLRRVPPSSLIVRVCTGLSCAMEGALELQTALVGRAAELGIEVQSAPCLFACAMAPVVEMGDASLGRATEASVVGAIQEMRDDRGKR